MNWSEEELIANEWLSGYLGDPDYEISTGKPTPAPGPYRPLIQAKPYANIRQLVSQAAQPTGYAPAAMTPGLQAALRARQALVTKAPVRVQQEAIKRQAQNVYRGASRAASDASEYVKKEVARIFDLPADSNVPVAAQESVLASQQRESLLRTKLASRAYDTMAPDARYAEIQKDMARVMAEAEYQRSAQQAAPAPVAPQSLEYGPRLPTAEEEFRFSKAIKPAAPVAGLKEFIGTVNAAADIKSKASAWASGFFGGGK